MVICLTSHCLAYNNARMVLSYGGDDITAALTAMLQKSNFPYKELDLSRPLQWQMMDNLKIKTITLEEVSLPATCNAEQ